MEPEDRALQEHSMMETNAAVNLSETDNEIKSLKESNESLTLELTKAKDALKSEEDKILTLSAELDAFRSMKQEYQELAEKLAHSEKNLTSLNEYKTEMDEEVKDIKSNFEMVLSERNAVQNEKNRLDISIEELESKNKELYAKSKRVLDIEEELKILRVLASIDSPAIDLYSVLKDHRSLDLRHLALQSGMAQQTCRRFVEKLKNSGLVNISGVNPDNPIITLRD